MNMRLSFIPRLPFLNNFLIVSPLKPFSSPNKMLRLLGIVLVILVLSIGGCAGKDPSTRTLERMENGTAATQVTSGDPSLAEESTPEVDFVDPFDDSPTETHIVEYDPLEPLNAAIFEFNYQFDKYLLKPVAKVYNFFVPPDVQQSIVNVFQNSRFVPRFLNNLFQAKFRGAGIEMSRFFINSTLGVGGLFDPAKIMFDLDTPLEDLGQTLGSYGVPPGPYLVVPFYGPFTLRDGFGFIGDTFLDPFNWLVLPIFEIADAPRLVQHDPTINYARLGLTIGETVNFRSLSLKTFQGVEEGTLDLYGAIRNGYLQQRQRAIQE